MLYDCKFETSTSSGYVIDVLGEGGYMTSIAIQLNHTLLVVSTVIMSRPTTPNIGGKNVSNHQLVLLTLNASRFRDQYFSHTNRRCTFFNPGMPSRNASHIATMDPDLNLQG